MDEQFALIKQMYYPPGACLRAAAAVAQVGVFHPSASTHDAVRESRNLPCHQDKDRNGVRLVLLKLCLSWPVAPAAPPLPPPTPPGQCSSVLEPREGEDVNTLRCCTKADSLGRAAYVYKLEFSF